MSERFNYNSSLAIYMNEFVSLKEMAGINTLRTRWILLEFDKFYLTNHITEVGIKREYIDLWSKTRMNDSPKTIYTKYSVWSQLARFMSRQGKECYIPQMPRQIGAYKNFTPYIFTHIQMDALMKKSSELRLPDRRMNCIMFCIPTIIRLIYSTGLRISEALSIKNEDVNLERQFIHIRKTKNGSERIIPISDSLMDVIKQYIFYRDRIPVKGTSVPESFLFIKTDGGYCRAGTVYTWFRRLLRECEIPYMGNHHGPRVHDLRHTYAVHALEQMSRNGMDLYACMPILSVCLGHKSLAATEQYVRLTQAMYPELLQQCSPISAFVYPKIQRGRLYED